MNSGCWSSPAGNTHDVVSERGITQPPPPNANASLGVNPRDPRNRKPRPVNDPSGTPEPTEPQPAPENSESSVMMNDDGSITEFRVFKGHPRINKVEANWLDPNDKAVKVFLTNGETLQTRTDRIPYLHKVTSELILDVVGIKRGAAKGDRPRVVGGN